MANQYTLRYLRETRECVRLCSELRAKGDHRQAMIFWDVAKTWARLYRLHQRMGGYFHAVNTKNIH